MHFVSLLSVRCKPQDGSVTPEKNSVQSTQKCGRLVKNLKPDNQFNIAQFSQTFFLDMQTNRFQLFTHSALIIIIRADIFKDLYFIVEQGKQKVKVIRNSLNALVSLLFV